MSEENKSAPATTPGAPEGQRPNNNHHLAFANIQGYAAQRMHLAKILMHILDLNDWFVCHCRLPLKLIPAFQPAHNTRRKQGHHQIQQGNHRPGLDGIKMG